jgi:hypothetical protein
VTRALGALTLLGGCYIDPGCGIPVDTLVRTGSYEESPAEGDVATTSSGTTPFQQPEGHVPSALEVTEDTVVLTYVDPDGREVVVTYDIAERSLY